MKQPTRAITLAFIAGVWLLSGCGGRTPIEPIESTFDYNIYDGDEGAAGSTAGNAGSGAAGGIGGSGGTAGAPDDEVPTPELCTACLDAHLSSCETELVTCQQDPDCSDLLTCSQTCTSTYCFEQCQEQFPKGIKHYQQFLTCFVCDSCYDKCHPYYLGILCLDQNQLRQLVVYTWQAHLN